MSPSPQNSSATNSPSPPGDSPASPSHHSHISHAHSHQQTQHRHQSQERCSILQACEPCKKKKTMCNMRLPCQGCRDSKQECSYPGSSSDLPRSISFAPTSSTSSSSTTSGSGSSSSTNRRLSSGSACETCRRRKTKCDGGTPCNFCAINSIECVNNSERRRRSIGPTGDVEAFEERLRKIEALVSNLIPPSPSGTLGGVDPNSNGHTSGIPTAKQQQAAMQARLHKLESALSNLPQLQASMTPVGHPNSPGTPGQRTPNPDTPPQHMIYQTSYMDPQPHHQYQLSYTQTNPAPAVYPSAGPISPPSLSPLNIASPAQSPPPVSEPTPPLTTPPLAEKLQHSSSISARSYPPVMNGYHGQTSDYQSQPTTPIMSGPGSPIPSPPAPGTQGNPAGLGISQIPSVMDQLSKRTFTSPPLTLPPLIPRSAASTPVGSSPAYHAYASFSPPQPSPPIAGSGALPQGASQPSYPAYHANGTQAFGLYPLPLTPTSPTTPLKGSSSSVGESRE